jgi:hypothetical protein
MVSDTLQYTRWSHSLNKPLKKAAWTSSRTAKTDYLEKNHYINLPLPPPTQKNKDRLKICWRKKFTPTPYLKI